MHEINLAVLTKTKTGCFN